MIKRLNSTELSAAKPRTGMQHVSGLVERLMKMYDMRAEMNEMREKEILAEIEADKQILDSQILDSQILDSKNGLANPAVIPVDVVVASQQSTFGWE